jgi:hypothetical protein
VSRRVDAPSAIGRGERRPPLRIDELARHDEIGSVPEIDSQLGAGFVEDQLDERRGVEVDDQPR